MSTFPLTVRLQQIVKDPLLVKLNTFPGIRAVVLQIPFIDFCSQPYVKRVQTYLCVYIQLINQTPKIRLKCGQDLTSQQSKRRLGMIKNPVVAILDDSGVRRKEIAAKLIELFPSATIIQHDGGYGEWQAPEGMNSQELTPDIVFFHWRNRSSLSEEKIGNCIVRSTKKLAYSGASLQRSELKKESTFLAELDISLDDIACIPISIDSAGSLRDADWKEIILWAAEGTSGLPRSLHLAPTEYLRSLAAQCEICLATMATDENTDLKAALAKMGAIALTQDKGLQFRPSELAEKYSRLLSSDYWLEIFGNELGSNVEKELGNGELSSREELANLVEIITSPGASVKIAPRVIAAAYLEIREELAKQ